MTPRLTRILHLVLRILLSLAFLAAGLPKFFPQSGWRERFAGWGYPAWFVLVIGALEIAGVIGFWVPRTAGAAMALLGVIMVGPSSQTSLIHRWSRRSARSSSSCWSLCSGCSASGLWEQPILATYGPRFSGAWGEMVSYL